MADLYEVLDKAPGWSDGIIVHSSGTIFPVKISKFGKDQYYFSPMWKSVSDEKSEERVILLKSGEKFGYEIVKDNGRYITVKAIHDKRCQ